MKLLNLFKQPHQTFAGVLLAVFSAMSAPRWQAGAARNYQRGSWNPRPPDTLAFWRRYSRRLLLRVSLAKPTSAASRLRSFSQQSINDQEEDSADGGDENATEVERFDLPEADEAAHKAADDRAGDADEDCDYDPAWVLPGHDKLCDSPGNEAQKDPGENAHAGFLGQIRPAGKDLFWAFPSGRR